MAKKWKTIGDDKVRHIWRCAECKTEAQISPEWYAGNGTPVCCDCDIDMEYLRTDIYQPPTPEVVPIIKELLRAFDSLMPGLKNIAVQDYQVINDAPIAARRWITKAQGGAS